MVTIQHGHYCAGVCKAQEIGPQVARDIGIRGEFNENWFVYYAHAGTDECGNQSLVLQVIATCANEEAARACRNLAYAQIRKNFTFYTETNLMHFYPL